MGREGTALRGGLFHLFPLSGLSLKAIFWVITDTKVLKHGEQIGFDTRVVHAVNDEYCILDVKFSLQANALNTPPGDYGRKIKTQRNCGEAVQAVEYVV